MKKVLITGCSSGFGEVTARLFLERGWHVVASVRSKSSNHIPHHERLTTVTLDVTDFSSASTVIEEVGDIDVLVNNAGVGMFGALESAPMQVIQRMFETNTLGTIAMTQAILPSMRKRRTGVIINVSSAITLLPLPLLSVYSASKAAINAFTESLDIELREIGLRAHIVMPGRAPSTRFGENARGLPQRPMPVEYEPLLHRVVAGMRDPDAAVTHPIDVAEAVWRAATDPGSPTKLPAGADAIAMATQAGLAFS